VILAPVAFYAPLKSPDDPSPSGDRTMARLLMKALAGAGYAPRLAGTLRTRDGVGDPARQAGIRAASDDEARRLIAHFGSLPEEERPRLWFTYHVYYKAPDWIGPAVSEALGIPYVVAEGSRAGKRAQGAWALGHQGAEAALDRAALVFVMTASDRVALEPARPESQALVDLPPFLDADEWGHDEPAPRPRRADGATPRLLTVAMMRPGDKLASYRILADSLRQLADIPWSLDVVGDGEARGCVEGAFGELGGRIRFLGQIDGREPLRRVYAAADLFVWPAVNEAYGMALLEAQLLGCPVVAGNWGGVSSVVRNGETGTLAPPGDSRGLADAVRDLLGDRSRLAAMGSAAGRFVRRERSLEGASDRLRRALQPLVADRVGS